MTAPAPAGPAAPAAGAAAVGTLVAAHAATRARLTATVTGWAAQQVRVFAGWYDPAAIRALADRIVRVVQAAQRQLAALTDAYLARVLSVLAGHRVQPVGPVPLLDLRAGVTPAGVYGRVADTYRWQRSIDTPPDRALDAAVTRAEVAVDTDLGLAFRAQAQRVMLVRSVDGWRRIVHPELSAGGTCGLCIVASDRVYHRADLMALHARCQCSVLPIVNGIDPGRSLDADALATLYAAAGSTAAADLKRTRYTVAQHGELGPVLVAAGDHFRGPPAAA